ncbi:MAG: hypothetical protein ACXVDA_27390, partial [Ktedonobacterales bacterium]
WQAAYLVCMGVGLVRVYRDASGRVNYEFENTDDLAWQTSLRFRNNEDCTVDAVAYMRAYKKLAQARDIARTIGEYQDVIDQSA